MNTKTRRILLVYIVITIVFASFVLFNLRDYQDSWILEDVFIETILYVLTFSIVVTKLDDNKSVALACAIFVIMLNAIPNLKYQTFYGTFDSAAHYGYVRDLLSLGFVPETGFYAPVYSDFPGMHIFVSTLSMVLGISAIASFKFVASTIFGIFPLMTYFVTNHIFEKDKQKYIIIASGLPILMSYALVGMDFALPLFFSCLYLIIRRSMVSENRRELALVTMIFASGVLFSHAVTTFVLTLLVGMAALVMRFADLIDRSIRRLFSARSPTSMYAGVGVFLVVSFTAWLIFRADYVSELFVESIRRVLFGEITETPIPTRLYQIPLSGQLSVFAVKHIKDAVIMMLAFAGLVVFVKKFRRESKYTSEGFYFPLLCFLGITLVLLILQLTIGFGNIEYGRLLKYAMVFTPPLVGLFLWQVNQSIRISVKPIVSASVLFVCISLCFISTFHYEPLIPTADVLSKDLPKSAYIVDFRAVNTIFQERMISFAEGFSSGDSRIASDLVTRWQIRGFSNQSFYARHIWWSPLEPNNETLNWDLFLVHYGEKSGPLNEKVEYRNRGAIEKLKDTLGNSVVYDNGESFIIAH